MTPRTVILIRHAEKPDDKRDPHLSARGQQRAQGLARYFRRARFRPQLLFAAAGKRGSNRPVETIEATAKALRLRIAADYTDADTVALGRELRAGKAGSAGKTVLVCWRYDTLPALARALGATHAPAIWPETVYDRLWRISYDARGQVRFHDVAQRLQRGLVRSRRATKSA